MNKIKAFFADKGFTIILGGALLLTLLLTMIINEVSDFKYEQQINNRQLEELNRLVEESREEAEEKGINPNFAIWEFDIEYLRDDFPKQYGKFEEHGSISDWNNDFSKLVNDINNIYISDEDIYQQIKGIVPDELFHFIPEDYLKGMALLKRDLIK